MRTQEYDNWEEYLECAKWVRDGLKCELFVHVYMGTDYIYILTRYRVGNLECEYS